MRGLGESGDEAAEMFGWVVYVASLGGGDTDDVELLILTMYEVTG